MPTTTCWKLNDMSTASRQLNGNCLGNFWFKMRHPTQQIDGIVQLSEGQPHRHATSGLVESQQTPPTKKNTYFHFHDHSRQDARGGLVLKGIKGLLQPMSCCNCGKSPLSGYVFKMSLIPSYDACGASLWGVPWISCHGNREMELRSKSLHVSSNKQIQKYPKKHRTHFLR